METTGQPPAATTGLSRFLLEHEVCGAGFDVQHPAGLGSGRLLLTCRGCGGYHEYATATIEFEREIEFGPGPQPTPVAAVPLASEPVVAPVAEPAPVLAPPPPPKAAMRPAGAPRRRPRKPPPNHRNAIRLRVLFVLAGIALLAFAAIRIHGENEESSTPLLLEGTDTTTPETSGEASPPTGDAPETKGKSGTQPSPTTKPEPKETAPTGGVAAAPGAKSGTEGQAATPATPQPQADEKVVETKRFSLIVPKSWRKRQTDVGYLLAPPGAAPASVWIFFERDPKMGPKAMIRQTSAFLTGHAPGGALGAPKRFSVAGKQVFSLRDRGRGAYQVGLGVIANPFRYLVIASVEAGTSAATKQAATRALRTFRPI